MRFVTFFPQGTNIHLVKDVGQIPYTLKSEYGMEAVLACGDMDLHGSYVDQVPGLQLDCFPFSWAGWRIGSIIYLLKNAKKIDWLNLYHAGQRTLCFSWIYKTLNSDGKIYLKLDMDLRGCDLADNDPKVRRIFQKCMEAADLVSVETSSVLKRIQKYTKKEILLIPNGYALRDDKEVTIEKENVFLTVGRLGTRQKATEILLEAFAFCAEKQDWKLRLIGSIEEIFKPFLDQFFSNHPELEKRVEFIGMIQDRDVLAKEYQRAKVFVLPSRWESFGLVIPEAESQGCRLILTSAVPGYRDFIPEPDFGKVIPPDDILCLAQALTDMAERYTYSCRIDTIIAYARDKFSWKNICSMLEEMLLG